MESIRTANGPRYHFLLNLGQLELPPEQWPVLAKRINDLMHGQENLVCTNAEVERLANQYTQTLNRKFEIEYDDTSPDIQAIDINRLSPTEHRTIGAEYVSLALAKKNSPGSLSARVGIQPP